MAILIKANCENTQLQTEFLKTVVKKMVDPLVENINWIKQEKAKTGTISEKQINQYVYDQANEYLDLIGEFCRQC